MGARVAAIAWLVVALLFAGGGTALAGRDWCATDPILEFADGTSVQWTTVFSADAIPTLTGPVTYRIVVPANAGTIAVRFPASTVSERVVIFYEGEAWSGKGGMPVQVSVLVPADGSFKTLTIAAGNVPATLTFAGVANRPTKANVKIDRTSWFPLIGSDNIVASFTVATDSTIDVR